MESIPPHLAHFPGLSIRAGDNIIAAPEADTAVARGYPRYADKGPWHRGRRITLMTAGTRVRLGERVRVIHVSETIRPGDELPVMGPKEVLGEFVDGRLRTRPAPPGDPFSPPGLYDGRIEPAPAADYNWDITEYVFDRAGRHTIIWKLGELQSNEIVIDVQP